MHYCLWNIYSPVITEHIGKNTLLAIEQWQPTHWIAHTKYLVGSMATYEAVILTTQMICYPTVVVLKKYLIDGRMCFSNHKNLIT